MEIDLFLSRLQNVHRSKNGWRADCPCGHQHARSSLSIAIAGDGRVLVHDFAGCDVHAVLAAIGVEATELLPERIRNSSPEARQRAVEQFKRNGWQAALGVLAREATVVLIAAQMMCRDRPLTMDDAVRLAVAIQRIEDARAVLA